MFIPIVEIRALIFICFSAAITATAAFLVGYWHGRKVEKRKNQERLLWRSRLD